MRLKTLVAGLGLVMLSLTARADEQAAPAPLIADGRTVLVEIINFHCPRCRALNDSYAELATAAKEANIPFRVVPATWQGQSLWPSRVYYAVRDLYPGLEGVIRDALFEGIQQEGQAFEELPQVIAYLERLKLPLRIKAVLPEFDLLAVADRAASDAPLISEVKVSMLIEQSGATAVPVFAWVRDGKVVHVLSPDDAPEPGPLARKVIQTLSATH